MKKIITLLVLILASLAIMSKLGPSITGAAVGLVPIQESQGYPPVVLFCPQDNCLEHFTYLTNHSKQVHCAFFDLDLVEIITALHNTQHQLIVDHRNYEKELLNGLNVRVAEGKSYLHNKFCIFDNHLVWTGSMNPTYRGNFKNHNNVVVIQSPGLARNYETEFQELWQGEYGKGTTTAQPIIQQGNITLQSYFCPEDDCAGKIVGVLNTAEKSIHFMTFSFTHPLIAKTLLLKHKQGLNVSGIFETQQRSKWSMFETLLQSGLPVVWDNLSGKVHHKVFIIDNTTVITGSMNPSRNGANRNDENVLIIKDKAVAQVFLKEFERMQG